MKKIKLLAIALAFTSFAMAQITAPQPSPLSKLEQTVGLTKINVEYSRPGKKDREIFGKLVPYGEMWRLGANASTKFNVDKDIKVNGKELKKGDYALYAIPGEAEWTIIFHNNTSYWGIGGYKEEEDALRVTAKPMVLKDISIETFSIDFQELKSDKATMMIMWDNVIVPIEITVNTDEEMAAQIKSTLIDGPGAGAYAAGAGYYLEKGENLEQALEWMNKAIEKRAEAFWYVHNKAKILKKMGKKKEAIETANKSIELAKAYKDGDFGYIKRNEELIESLK